MIESGVTIGSFDYDYTPLTKKMLSRILWHLKNLVELGLMTKGKKFNGKIFCKNFIHTTQQNNHTLGTNFQLKMYHPF